MLKNRYSIAFACLLAGTSLNAIAAQGGRSAGDMSVGHMSSAGQASTNGPASDDRGRGVLRADDRRSASGARHEK